MSAIPFPNLKPSSRSYSPGQYPQTEFRAQNGARTIVRFGNRRVDSSLQLSFSNITDAQAALILDNYQQVNRDWNNVTFTAANGTAGADSPLASYLAENGGSGLLWRYSGPPSVQSVYPGISSVSCQFVGILDGN